MELFVAKLPLYFSRLHEAGIVVEPHQHSLVVRLISKVGAKKRDAKNSEELMRLMVPILAGTQTEQWTCRDQFLATFIDEDDTEKKVFIPPENDDSTNKFQIESSIAKMLAISSVIALVILLVVLLRGIDFSGNQTALQLERVKPDDPGRYATSIPDWINEYPIKELEPPGQSPFNRTLRWYYTEYEWKKYLAAGIPWLIYIAIISALFYLTLGRLRRELLKEQMKTLPWQFNYKRPRLGGRKVLSSLQPLRQYPREYIRVFDEKSTVFASAANGGLLSPRFRQKIVPADFVALIDRRSPGDHLTSYNEQLVQIIRDAGISVETFYFSKNPSFCVNKRTGESKNVSDIATMFAESIILVFLSEEELINPGTGTIHKWISHLQKAGRCVLFVPSAKISENGLQLANFLGFDIIQGTALGIKELSQHLMGGLTSGRRKKLADSHYHSGEFERLIENINSRSDRWNQNTPIPKKEVSKFLTRLRQVAGEKNYRWFASTAVYPQLLWPMTFGLNRKFGNADSVDEWQDEGFLTMLQLPWFRNGWMPDWMRSNILKSMEKSELRKIYNFLLDKMGVVTNKFELNDKLDISLDEQAVKEIIDPIKKERILLDFLIPLLNSKKQFNFSHDSLRRIAKKPIRQLILASGFGALLAATGSFASLSFLDIDECDLWGASLFDENKVGPGWINFLMENTGFVPKIVDVCSTALAKNPDNDRFRYQYIRAHNSQRNLSPAQIEFGMTELTKLASNGYVAAMNSLGVHYDGTGMLEEPDMRKSIEYYELAIENGAVIVADNLMRIYDGSTGSSYQNYEKYLELEKLIVQNQPPLQYTMAANYREGLEFEDGNIIEANWDKYITTVQQCADTDSVCATELGYLYDIGEFGDPDTSKSSYWYRHAIKLGADETAAYNLAQNYRFGEDGVDKDNEQAAYWAIFAAKLGDQDAFNLVEEMIFDGSLENSTRSNIRLSAFVAHWRQQAESGKASAQYYLGRYLMGKPGREDESKEWYRKAANQGYEKASDALSELED